jgi:AcrR family transcriptional regulator
MPKSAPPQPPPPAKPPRRPRVDGQRNRERILEVARQAFTQHGPDATLDDIARRAEIGPGTLYRHFPTREALIEAVFRDQVDKLTAAGHRLSITLAPLGALRAWMLLFIDYVARKVLIMPAMDTVPGGSMRMIEGTRTQIQTTFRALLHNAMESHELRPDIDPDDLLRAFFGVFQTTAMPGWESSARRIVDILIDGSRPRA